MKRIFAFVSLIAAMVLAGSCQQELDPVKNGDTTVTFKVTTDDIVTKANPSTIADGMNIDVLYWEIYYAKDIETAAGPLGKGVIDETTVEDGHRAFDVTLKLLADQKYKIVFWAQVKGNNHYTWDDLRCVKINTYSDENANDESRAAFFRVYEFETENGASINERVDLYRPFSQLNLGTTTYETDLNQVNGGQVKVESSQVTVTKIANMFNTINGEKGCGESDTNFDGVVTFTAAPTPNGDDDATYPLLEVNDENYYWLGMNYLIVDGASDNVKVDIELNTNMGTVKHTVNSVPIKQNYRTNILGNFLTTGATFKVVVDEEFNKPDEIVNVAVASTALELQAAVDAAPGDGSETNIQLNGDIDLSSIVKSGSEESVYITIPKTKKITLDLNGYNLKGTDHTEKNFGLIQNNGILSVTNGSSTVSTITLNATVNSNWGRYSAVISNNPGANLTVGNNIVIEHLGGTDMAYGIDALTNGTIGSVKTVIDGATVKSPYRAVRQFLNSDSKENELTVKAGSVLEGASKSIFFHDPSSKANLGKLVVEDNAQLKGDVYLFVTENSTKWPVEVSIASSALVGESTVTYKNVPAGYEVVKKDGVWVIEKDYEWTDDATCVIYTANGLKWFANEVNKYSNYEYPFKGMTIQLMNDIDLEGIEWTPIGDYRFSANRFCGTFDGQNNTISNFKITKKTDKNDSNKSSYGFFGNVEGTVKNLTISNATISSYAYTAALVGRLNSGLIENCHIMDCTVSNTYWQGGILIGQVNGTSSVVRGCTVKNSSVTSKSAIGAISGPVTAEETDNDDVIIFENCSVEDCSVNQEGSFGESYDGFFGSMFAYLKATNTNVYIKVINCKTKNTTVKNQTDAPISGDIDGNVFIDGSAAISSAEELTAAMKAGGKYFLTKDITIADKWDNRYTGKSTTEISIDGNGKTIKFSGEINDGANYYSAFRFENTATVKNLTIDMSEASAPSKWLRAISSHGELTVENCTFIGNDKYSKANAVVFGDKSGVAQHNYSATITGCTFTNWSRGITDNENANEVKNITVIDNTCTNAQIYVSAYNEIVVTNNVMSNGQINITSYSNAANAKVTATGNTLDAEKYNVIGSSKNTFTSANVEAQEGFTVNAQ